MYITQLDFKHIKEVAELESKTYPEQLCLGYDDIKHDFLRTVSKMEYNYNIDNNDEDKYEDIFTDEDKPFMNMNNYSLGVFHKGELKGYILAYSKRETVNLTEEEVNQIVEAKNLKFKDDSSYKPVTRKDISDFKNVTSIYVSDIICKNPIYLQHLLISFINYTYTKNRESFKYIEAECRESSFKMINKLKDKGLINFTYEKLDDYYYSLEDAYKIIIDTSDLGYFYKNIINNIPLKTKIINHICTDCKYSDYNFKHLNNVFHDFLELEVYNFNSARFLKKSYEIKDNYGTINYNKHTKIFSTYGMFDEEYGSCINYTLDELIEYKDIIIKYLNIYNEEVLYKMNNINICISYFNKYYNGYDKVLSSLNKYIQDNNIQYPILNTSPNGMLLEDMRNLYKANPNQYKFYRLYNNESNGRSREYCTLNTVILKEYKWNLGRTISNYRSTIRSLLKKYNKFDSTVIIFDKYDESFCSYSKNSRIKNTGIIPYCNDKTISYKIKTLLAVQYIKTNCKYYDHIKNYLDVRKIISIIGIDNYYKLIDNINKLDNKELAHDCIYLLYYFIHDDVKDFFTKGAYLSLFMINNINTNRKIYDLLSGYYRSYKKQFSKDIKEHRKIISKHIRNNDYNSLEEYIKNNRMQFDKKELNKYKLPKKLNTIAYDFIDRVNVYATHVTLISMLKLFGKEEAISYITGQKNSLFEAEELLFDYTELSNFILDYLKSNKNKRGRKLYGLFNKNIGIDNIKNNIYSLDDINFILDEFQNRDIEYPSNFNSLRYLSARIEQKCSPEFLVAGNASVCCMSYGASNAKDYAMQEGFGILNVYYKDRIIANSVLWINELYNIFVIDNIEVAPNYKRDDILYNIKKLYLKNIINLSNKYETDYIIQGQSYNDLELYDTTTQDAIYNVRAKAKGCALEYIYTDTDRGCYALYNKDEEIENRVNEINIELNLVSKAKKVAANTPLLVGQPGNGMTVGMPLDNWQPFVEENDTEEVIVQQVNNTDLELLA